MTSRRPLHRRRFLVGLSALAGIAALRCGDGDGEPPTPSPSATASPSPTATASPTPTPVPDTPTPTPEPTPAGPALEPTGFPIDPNTKLGMVTGEPGSRALAWGAGPTAYDYSLNDQPSADPVAANRCGWNARVHVEYEALPAVDWYIKATPIRATMDGAATLLINTISNPFDVYGVSREPYIGNPDRARAPVSPFPGPGGGQGVFVRIENGQYRTDYAHLDLAPTMREIVPASAWLSGYKPGEALLDQFAPLRDYRTATAVARWDVRKGDAIGISGDAGYSEAPHLHYTVQILTSGGVVYRCPTNEPGFNDAGWLFR